MTNPTGSSLPRVRLSLREKGRLLGPYAAKRLGEQVQAVALIVAYLVLFQVVVLGLPIAESAVIALGIAGIVVGLAFFMEGLFLGLMPLGETIGVKLPQRSSVPVILTFALILGVGVTFAEPAIGVLQIAGSFIKAWDAPLLFDLLNRDATALKYAVGLGVGLAVVAGMLRFLYRWSLKPFLLVSVPLTLGLTVMASLDPNLSFVVGLAWDCGGVTTGPVTVPLVLALGIGVSRVVCKDNTESGGFGVVTLASLFPIVAVLVLAVVMNPTVPQPSSPRAFFAEPRAERLFDSRAALVGYALRHADEATQASLFAGGQAELLAWIGQLRTDEDLRLAAFGTRDPGALERWAVQRGSPAQRAVVYPDPVALRAAVDRYGTETTTAVDWPEVSLRNALAAVQAILPLVLFLVLVLVVVLRQRLPQADQVLLGVVFAIFGMGLFNIGIELGLSKLGNQVGAKLPASFMKIELTDQRQVIEGFDEGVVHTALRADGTREQFFYANLNGGYLALPYDEKALDRSEGRYLYTPTKGPLFGLGGEAWGVVLVLFFAFVMGYGATMAEPALNALGATVETLTVGAFRKNLLMQAVAVGVGLGILVGVLKVLFNIPLLWILLPPYLILMGLNLVSTEEFVNIGWDSAGVTTGPITVPLVLAMGLGLSGQVGVVEGFGILASASVFPILSVLAVGLFVRRRPQA